MFSRVFGQLLYTAAIDIIFTMLLTCGTLFADKSAGLHVILFLFVIYWFILEIVLIVYNKKNDDALWTIPRSLTPYKTFHYLKIIFGMVFLIRSFNDIYSAATRFAEALLLLFTWWETIRYLRYWDSVRWMFRMLYMILFRSIPFMIVYLLYIFMIAF